MKEIEVFFNIEDINGISSIPGFINSWEYNSSHPLEWGCIQTGVVLIKFIAFQPERLSPEDERFLGKLEIPVGFSSEWGCSENYNPTGLPYAIV